MSIHRAALKRLGVFASTLAVLSLLVAQMAWMAGQVAEYPGVPREVGALPPWFTGEPRAIRERDAPARASGAPAHEAHAPAHEAASAAVPDADFVDATGGTVEIALGEYALKPNRIRVAPGTVTFVLRNQGRFSHDFHVEGAGVDAYAAKFSPGRTVRLEVTLQEGEYKLSCPLSNHDERGMRGKLIATSRASGK